MFFSQAHAQAKTLSEAQCLSEGSTGIPTLRCIETIVQNLLSFTTYIVFGVFFLLLIRAAFYYLMAGGDDSKVAAAKSTIKYALFGVLVFAASYTILMVVQLLFLGDPADPAVPSLFRLKLN
ncbi:MAG: hypothetical protein UZ21_OP11001001088 [Microgenomates bacterium OLB22]|nr:MAG: hypothetical protein UZ21_OP11001001088 [Microgenomates bacterium OLB22]